MKDDYQVLNADTDPQAKIKQSLKDAKLKNLLHFLTGKFSIFI